MVEQEVDDYFKSVRLRIDAEMCVLALESALYLQSVLLEQLTRCWLAFVHYHLPIEWEFCDLAGKEACSRIQNLSHFQFFLHNILQLGRKEDAR